MEFLQIFDAAESEEVGGEVTVICLRRLVLEKGEQEHLLHIFLIFLEADLN